VKKAGMKDFCFIRDIENYQKIFSDSRELMDRAREEIIKCDALLIDFSVKSTGRTIEAGIAFDAGKKIIVIVKRGIKLNATAEGIADIVIEYDRLDDIVEPLKKFIEK
jgi:hypothetical protein